MLVLAREAEKNEDVIIDLRPWGLGTVRVVVTKIRGDRVWLGFDADERIVVDRLEVFEKKERNAG
jgi:sRNA-binding carbon storage regulator CsrA